MNNTDARRLVSQAWMQLGRGPLDEGWSGIDAVLPLLERMRQEGAVVLLKLDGERARLPYTVVASRSDVEEGTFRLDVGSIEEGLAQLIAWYGTRFWRL